MIRNEIKISPPKGRGTFILDIYVGIELQMLVGMQRKKKKHREILDALLMLATIDQRLINVYFMIYNRYHLLIERFLTSARSSPTSFRFRVAF